MIVLSNPVRNLRVLDWPAGNDRVTALFHVGVNRYHGERVLRTTITKDGQVNRSKKTPYYQQCAIVQGNDGKHYVISRAHNAMILTDGNLRFPKSYYRDMPAHRSMYRQINRLLNAL